MVESNPFMLSEMSQTQAWGGAHPLLEALPHLCGVYPLYGAHHLWGSSLNKESLRRPPSSESPHRPTIPLPRPRYQIDTRNILPFQLYVPAIMSIPDPCQGIRRRRDEEDNNSDSPPSSRQHVDPDEAVDFIRRPVRFPVRMISILMKEL